MSNMDSLRRTYFIPLLVEELKSLIMDADLHARFLHTQVKGSGDTPIGGHKAEWRIFDAGSPRSGLTSPTL